ncbi:putative component of NuA3 histone acetyltransferase complex [Entomophthora muscae]|uniref:Component of NuA3 histone acetyltransferase complex n=1 Tax=Entomophthora muscae TaxID=34485 RepID=A0ACC2SPS2_9FUNG|nr:putative component of NuA3 histone acetyltransferase complex [Entomophthora muscae]
MQSKKQKNTDSINPENFSNLGSSALIEPSTQIVSLNGKPGKGSKDKVLLNDHLKLDSHFFREYSILYQNKQASKIYHVLYSEDNLNESYSQIITEPFLAGTIGDVFDHKFLRKVKTEIEIHMTYSKKNNDLYEFYQSSDLKSTKLKLLKRLCDSLYSEGFVKFLSELTGVQLNNTLDASVSKYVYGNHLLCHDDDIQTTGEGRRIAFIIYLVDESWTEADGGALELFSRDQFGQPTHASKCTILPKCNQMAFFEIGSHSYHQVAEVLAKCKDRLSVVGWFHGPLPTQPPPLNKYSSNPFSQLDCDLSEFINPDYLGSAKQEILKKFKEDGCVELQSFIRPEIYQALLSEAKHINWGSPRGPAHVRNYHIASISTTTFQAVSDMLSSQKFKRFLAELSGCDLTCWRGELQKFDSRNYSLLNDEAIEPSGLDFTLYFTDSESPAWNPIWGGGLHYLRWEETLYSIHPKPNCLFLANRPDGTLRFVKYVKTQARYPIHAMSFVFN